MTSKERDAVVNGLGNCIDYFAGKVTGVMFNEWLEESRKAIALLKAQEAHVKPKFIELADAYGLTVEGVQFALEQYQTVICAITHGKMSKLSYFADDILRVADEVKCAGCELQEPRVMTLEEVLATEVVYAEDIDKAEIIPVLVNRRAHDRIVLVRAHLMGGPSHVIYPLISEYGQRWRCWTSRPTDQLRKATPW